MATIIDKFHCTRLAKHNSRLLTNMTGGTCTSTVTMVTQSSNNPDYYTGLSGSWWVGEKRAWYPLFVHAHKFSEILGNWELNIMLHLPFSVCTSSDQQWRSFNRLFYFTIQRPPVLLIWASRQHRQPPFAGDKRRSLNQLLHDKSVSQQVIANQDTVVWVVEWAFHSSLCFNIYYTLLNTLSIMWLLLLEHVLLHMTHLTFKL